MSYEYLYIGEMEGMVPGVGLVEQGTKITPSGPEHEDAIKATGLFKRVKAEAAPEKSEKPASTGGKE